MVGLDFVSEENEDKILKVASVQTWSWVKLNMMYYKRILNLFFNYALLSIIWKSVHYKF